MTIRIAPDADVAPTNGAPPAPSLADGAVHVWAFELDAVSGDRTAPACVLDAAELDRAARFRFEKHRHRFVAGRSAVRRILARYAACDPSDLRFDEGAHGKPAVAGPACARAFSFNASGSHGLGAIAVTRCVALGLDIEQIRPSRDLGPVASRQFCAEENVWLDALPPTERVRGFYEIWTCKEAYLKGKGLGLGAGLDRFAISMEPDGTPRLAWSAIDADDPARWLLHRIAIKPGFAGCLAVAGAASSIRSARWPG